MKPHEPRNLVDLLDKLDGLADGGPKVSVEQVMDAVGRRSFGPLLLLAGLLGMTPVAAVPGAPTAIAATVLLVSGQLLFGRKSFWLPGPLLRARISTAKLQATARVARKPATIVDRWVKPRLQVLTRPIADRVVAGVCSLLAILTPPLELLPFVAFLPSSAVATFGLGLFSRDGLLILIALVVSAGALAFAAYQFVT
jgi:hypothetical protein